MKAKRVPGSFRDPSGSLFTLNGDLLRRVSYCYKENYDHLISSGLYRELVNSALLIPHEEVSVPDMESPDAYKILKPKIVPFVSYPYEWCFSQLKDAARATLEIQKKAMDHGMTLKDCSAYNIQYYEGRPVLIDTLSFEIYREGEPWTPYRQFCQHFLAPLALMSSKDVRLNQLFRVHIDGIPLDLAGKMLPFHSRLSFSLLFHIHLHAKSQRYYADRVPGKSSRTPKVSRQSLLGLIGSLESAIAGLKWKPQGTEWVNYYEDDSYTPEGMEHKNLLVSRYLEAAGPRTVWDLGANNGVFSRIASDRGTFTVSFDIDPACVELNYLQSVKEEEKNILPLLLDLTNPSPAIGWANDERMSVPDRGPADTAMALALIHHLAISNNVPLGRISDFFASLCSTLIIEFVPKSDHKVQKLLSTREDVFPNYTQEVFEKEFSMKFEICETEKIISSERTLYLMVRK